MVMSMVSNIKVYVPFNLIIFMSISIMYWNVQGAASSKFRCSFKTIVKNYNSSLVVLMEPRVSGIKAYEFIKKSDFDNSHRVEVVGFSGGNWLLWRSFIEVDVLFNHRQIIHFRICMNNAFVSWATYVYASPNPMLWRQLWNHMDCLARSIQGPWLIGGDFNSILYASEKHGGIARHHGVCGLFRQWFNGHQIFYLKFKGQRFTWPRETLLKRLDSALCNNDWLLKFADNYVLHLPKVASDHRPVLVQFKGADSRKQINRPFQFLASWLTHEHFNTFVK